jgi:hypothetical protein
MENIGALIALRELVFNEVSMVDIISKVVTANEGFVKLIEGPNPECVYIDLDISATGLMEDRCNLEILQAIANQFESMDSAWLLESLAISKEEAISLIKEADHTLFFTLNPSFKKTNSYSIVRFYIEPCTNN